MSGGDLYPSFEECIYCNLERVVREAYERRRQDREGALSHRDSVCLYPELVGAFEAAIRFALAARNKPCRLHKTPDKRIEHARRVFGKEDERQRASAEYFAKYRTGLLATDLGPEEPTDEAREDVGGKP